MRALLLPASHTRKCIKIGAPDFAVEERGAIPPLGVLYIASSLEKHGYSVKVLDTQFEEFNDYRRIEQEIIKIKPDVVGIQVLTFSLPDALILARIIKKIDSDIKIVFGGRHIDIYPKETIQFKDVDALIRGEAEFSFPELLKHGFDIEKLKKVKGLVLKDKEKTVATGPPEIIKNLDKLPFPARHLIGDSKYGDLLSKKKSYTTMISSRGCSYRCSFCDNHHKFRMRKAENVVDEMEQYVNKGIEEIMIYDSTFTTDRKRVFKICQIIKERNLNFSWSTPTRVDCIDEKMIKVLKEAGCERLQYGIEAGTQKTLDRLRKGTNIQQIKKAINLTREAGITTFADFMIGSPGETREDILTTIKLAQELKIDYATFQITMPYPDTYLYKGGVTKGILKKDYWQEFAENPTENFEPSYWEEYLTKKELNELLELAFRKFYLRPTYVAKCLARLNSWESFKRQFRAGIKLTHKLVI